MNQTIELMKNHRSVRKYKNEMLSDEVLQTLIDVAQAAPNSINGQQTTIIVVKDPEAKKQFAELTGGQTWIEECSAFLVFVMDFKKSKYACEKNDRVQTITDSVEAIMVGSVDAGITMQNVVTAAESMGLGTVCIGGIRNNPEKVIEMLGLPQYTYPIVGLCVGVPDGETSQKPRMPQTSYCHAEKYSDETLKADIDGYDEVISEYLKEGGREHKENWSISTSNYYQHVYFPKVYPTLKQQGFLNEK